MSRFKDKSNKEKIVDLLHSFKVKSEMNDSQGAIEDLTKLIEINPDIGQTYYLRGLEYIALNQFDNAIKDLEMADNRMPNNDQVLLNLAGSKRHNGDMKGAYRDYSKALLVNPNNADLWHNRGHIKRYAGDSTGAAEDFRMAVSLGDESCRKWVRICSMLGNIETIDNLIDIVPLNVDELINEGINYKSQGNWVQALSFITRAVELYPHLEMPIRYKTQLEREIGL